MIINYYNPLPFLPRCLWPDENSALVTVIYPRESPAGFNTCGLRGALTCGGDIPHPRPPKIPFSPPSHSFSRSPFPPGFPALSVALRLLLALCCGASWGSFCVLPAFLPSPSSHSVFCSCWLSPAPVPLLSLCPVRWAGREAFLCPQTPFILLSFGAGVCQPQEQLTHISPQILTRLPTPRSPSLPSAPCHLPRCSVEAKPP